MTVEALEQPSGTRVLRVVGELDVRSADRLLPTLPELVADAGAVVLDLAAVTFFDSSGCRLVDRLARESAGSGVPFRVVAPLGCASRRVLEIVGMAEPLVSETVDDALAVVAAERA